MDSYNYSAPVTIPFPTGKRELYMGLAVLPLSIIMADLVTRFGLNFGFVLTACGYILLSFLYLMRSGCKPQPYAITLLALSAVICLSFLRSDDPLIKLVMLLFMLLSGNLAMALTAGQNLRDPEGFTSLLDAPRVLFTLGIGKLGPAFSGLNAARKNAGAAGKKSISILGGLMLAVPLLAVMMVLLMRADAAFEGLVYLLPAVDLTDFITALLLGVPLACVLYTRNVALWHNPRQPKSQWQPKKYNVLTVGTVLIMVCLLYLVYLFSQLAYFSGGFSGILPKEFTMAEYARRGFFELAWLSGINLGIIALATGLSEKKDGRISMVLRLCCLFIGLMTLFFAVAASAKMLLYIESYGLTTLRLLTEIIMIFLALTVVFVLIWLFLPKFAYMKAILLTALIIGAAVAWADVDTVVAAYNVNAYQTGQHETVDVVYLCQLGSGAVPQLHKLAQDADPRISDIATQELQRRASRMDTDPMAFNIADAIAGEILAQYK